MIGGYKIYRKDREFADGIALHVNDSIDSHEQDNMQGSHGITVGRYSRPSKELGARDIPLTPRPGWRR